MEMRMLYAPETIRASGTNGSGSLPPIKKIEGRGLAATLPNLSAARRAILLADIFDGSLKLQNLTISQLCTIMGVSKQYAFVALKLTPEQRAEVKRNERPLVARKPKPKPSSGSDIFNSLRQLGAKRVPESAVEVERSPTQAGGG
jgi:hypothetical protein